MSETSTAGVKNNLLRRAALAGMFAAAGVVLSVVSIPVGPTKCFPFQHAINVIAGVTLGPAWAVGAAFTTSLVRNMLGTGSLFAFPGSMFGALLDGIAAMLLPQKYKIAAAVAEPVGTGIIGAWVSAAFVAPFMGKNLGFAFFSASFLMSCVPGAIIGAAVLWCLRKRLLFASHAGVLL